MTTSTRARAESGFSPFDLQHCSLAWKVAAVILGTVVLAASSHIEFPMYPVPVTLQTFAVGLIGALYGWRLGGVTIVAWLCEGALGLPVLAGGAAGVQHFFGPTGGYLLAFPMAGMAMGWLAERGWNGQRTGLAFAGMLISNLICLVVGATWLAVLIGVEQAVMAGVVPFLSGAVLKSAAAALVLKLLSGRMKPAAG